MYLGLLFFNVLRVWLPLGFPSFLPCGTRSEWMVVLSHLELVWSTEAVVESCSWNIHQLLVSLGAESYVFYKHWCVRSPAKLLNVQEKHNETVLNINAIELRKIKFKFKILEKSLIFNISRKSDYLRHCSEGRPVKFLFSSKSFLSLWRMFQIPIWICM